jgi:hypothetical protein
VDKIKDIRYSNHTELLRLINGGISKPRRKIYIEQDEAIERLWVLYIQGRLSLERLVTGLKNNIKLKN